MRVVRLGHGLGGEQVLEVVAHADAPRVLVTVRVRVRVRVRA